MRVARAACMHKLLSVLNAIMRTGQAAGAAAASAATPTVSSRTAAAAATNTRTA